MQGVWFVLLSTAPPLRGFFVSKVSRLSGDQPPTTFPSLKWVSVGDAMFYRDDIFVMVVRPTDDPKPPPRKSHRYHVSCDGEEINHGAANMRRGMMKAERLREWFLARKEMP